MYFVTKIQKREQNAPLSQENGSTTAFETFSMPQSVTFLSLTGDVAQTNDPVRTRYPDSLSPSWLDNPIVKTHGEPVHQVPVLRYSAEQLENPLQILAQHSNVTANISTNVNTSISSSRQSAGFLHSNAKHLLVSFEITTNIPKHLF